jgi:choline monooxygenase
MQPFSIDPDIARAQTLPAEVYASPAWYAVQKERVFARSSSCTTNCSRDNFA